MNKCATPGKTRKKKGNNTMISRVAYFLREFLLPHIAWYIIAFLSGLLAASANGLGIPIALKYVFPVVFMKEGGELPELLQMYPSLSELPRHTLLLAACATLPAMFLIRGISMWINAFMVNFLGVRILESLRMKVFHHVQELPISYLESQRKGDLISRIVADTANVQNVLSQVANDLIKQPVTAICGISAFVWLLFSSGQSVLLLVNIVLLSIVIVPIFVFGKRISRKALRSQQGLGELNSILQQNLEAQREVRAYAMEEREIKEFDNASQTYCTNYLKLVKYQKALIPLMETVTALALAILLVRGRLNGMVLSDFMAIAAALFFTFDSLKRAGTAFNRFNEAQGSLSRLEEVLQQPNGMPERPEPQHFSAPVRGSIEMRNVSFSYASGKQALHNINITIPAGQVVGLVGPSGAGKTTFASLVPRFYDASQGSVCIDGIDVKDLSYAELRRHISLVGQQALLFSGSIEENIRLGRIDADNAAIRQAADAAAVGKFLDGQSKTMDTQLGEGGLGLSGGQRQRVAIARAFVKNAPILILDEATASLDAESEREIQESLDELAQGRTTLIVAHRFSTIRHADRILVFDAGSIIGDGSHEELYSSCPLYKELYDRQSL